MSLSIRYKNTKRHKEVKYQEWYNDIVKKGKADEYEVVANWDIVQVMTRIFGVWIKYEITEIKFAKLLQQQKPSDFRYVGIDINKRLNKDYELSRFLRRSRILSLAMSMFNNNSNKRITVVTLRNALLISVAIIGLPIWAIRGCDIQNPSPKETIIPINRDSLVGSSDIDTQIQTPKQNKIDTTICIKSDTIAINL